MESNATVAADFGAAQIHERAARAHVELARWWTARGENQLARRELSRATIRRRAADIERHLDVEG